MPDTDSEPENYSIDDMMDRLRSRGADSREGEGKLVTREDGTQVYKMRKRKRRSQQPKKQLEKRQRRVRVMQVIAAVGLVAGSGLALLGSYVYLNSPGYHQEIVNRVRVWTGAQPEIGQFRVTPVSAAAATLDLQWPETSMIRSLKVNGISADLRIPALLSGKWKGSEMLGGLGGTMVLDFPTPGESQVQPAPQGESPFSFRYRVPKFNLLMGDAERPTARLRETEASLDVLEGGDGVSNVRFEGGAMSLPGWADLPLRSASFQISEGGLRLGNARFIAGKEGRGEIELLNPEQHVLDLSDGSASFAVRLRRVPLDSLMGPNFGNWVTAEVETEEKGPDGSFVIRADAPADFLCEVPYKASASSESSMGGLQMFGIIARETQEAWYQSPRFEHGFSGIFKREPERNSLNDLRMEARNRLMITGRIALDRQGTFDGTLEVGLPDGTVNEASGAFRNLFNRREGGYSWATVKITGNSRQPVDDFQKQLDAAATLAPTGAGTGGALEDAFRELTEPEQ